MFPQQRSIRVFGFTDGAQVITDPSLSSFFVTAQCLLMGASIVYAYNCCIDVITAPQLCKENMQQEGSML